MNSKVDLTRFRTKQWAVLLLCSNNNDKTAENWANFQSAKEKLLHAIEEITQE